MKVNWKLLCKLVGILLFIESFALFISSFVSLYYDDGDFMSFWKSVGITFLSASVLFLIGKNSSRQSIGKKEGYILVSLVWVLFSVFGMLPFLLGGYISNVTDAFFETISGFTTTGATILNDIEVLPHGILFWRSLIQWLGGMGIVLLSMAILQILNIGGFALFTAEAPGPTYDKLHPRMKETARILWYVYFLITAIEVLCLFFSGMGFFDSVCHSFTTMATGGFSTKNASIAYWNSPLIEGIITVFMFIAGVNFPLIYWVLRGKFSKVRHNEEFKVYLTLNVFFSLVLSLGLYFTQEFDAFTSLRKGFFHVISFVTTTGYVTSSDYSSWNGALWFLLMFVMLFGGMAGSTAGGIKTGRLMIYFKSTINEFKKSVHSNAVFPVKYNGKSLPLSTISNVFGFFVLYFLLIFVCTLIMMALGLDLNEALGNCISSIGDVGPGFGRFASSYSSVPVAGKWIMSFLMLVGRLEIYTIFLLFIPNFWKN